MKKATLPEKFDGLFALVHELTHADLMDTWMTDNQFLGPDGKTEKAIDELSKAWKSLLSKSDEELGLDTVYSRPGIEALLSEFAEKISNCDHVISNSFVWQN